MSLRFVGPWFLVLNSFWSQIIDLVSIKGTKRTALSSSVKGRPISKKPVAGRPGVKGGPFGTISKNVLPDERGVKGGPVGPISKKCVAGRTG